ncbi:hypothetical protein J4E91_010259 [Alternaria rosae]|nr:hypothetical protein J4E91_010259 [Alternaria rosae]
MPPATEYNKSGAPRVDLRSAIGLLQSYHTAIDGKPDAEKPSLVDCLRQRPAPPKEEHPTPSPKPVPEADQHSYYTFGEEIGLKCEGGKIVVKGHKY